MFACHPVTNLAELGQSFNDVLVQVTKSVACVSLYRTFRLLFSHAFEIQAFDWLVDAQEGRVEQPGHVLEVQALVTEIHRVIQLLRIERPLLGAERDLSTPQ